MNSNAQLSAAQHLTGGPGATAPSDHTVTGGDIDDDDDIPDLEAPQEEEGPVDETGVDPKEIELVMQQVRPSLRHRKEFHSTPFRWVAQGRKPLVC